MEAVTEGMLLDGRVKYRQLASGHRSGFEPVLLAACVGAQAGERVLDAGTGAGAALLCLGQRVPGVAGIGLEIEGVLVGLANENFKLNELHDFSCIQGDVAAPGFGAVFDHVMSNPPWHPASGTRSPDARRALAHHAPPGLLAAWVAGMAGCLKPRGTITLILPAPAVSDGIAALRAAQCGAITLLPLWPRQGQPARQIILGARRGGRGPGGVLPGLALHGPEGISAAAEAVLRAGGRLVLL